MHSLDALVQNTMKEIPLTVNSFQGGCNNCGYGKRGSVIHNIWCPFCWNPMTTNSDEEMRERFERAIEENPYDSSRHHIYGDYLEERGDSKKSAYHRAMGKAIDSGAMIHRNNVEGLQYGQTLYHVTNRNRDGTALRVRVNGRTKLWKRRPDDFRVPTKYGYRGWGHYITPDNAYEWLTHDITGELPKEDKKRRG